MHMPEFQPVLNITPLRMSTERIFGLMALMFSCVVLLLFEFRFYTSGSEYIPSCSIAYVWITMLYAR
jgi:hypothetical protein